MAKIKNICLLGSTGSIGQNSLEVIANFPDRFRVSYLSAHRNIDLLEEQIRRFRPKGVAVLDESSALAFKKRMNGSVELFAGPEGASEIARMADVDIVIGSMVGFAGMQPTIEAIRNGKTVALANKETLVVAGELIMKLAHEHGATIIPVDSEHSAIMQCLAGEDSSRISRLILTASGGPFLNLPAEKFSGITVEDALRHPNWKMGHKITIDSAPMMNKGLEVIEAHWLFGLPIDNIEVVVHPQSIVHSMVEFVDGSVKAQLGIPDMKIPIQYALTYPERLASKFPRIDFALLREMTFFAPDRSKFECLALAYEAIRVGGTAPAVLNAANEVAVDLFLNRKISFSAIPKLVRSALERCPVRSYSTMEDIIHADAAARNCVCASAPSFHMKG